MKKLRSWAKQVDSLMAKNDTPLDEVSVLNDFLKKIPEDRFRYIEAETKWMKIFV